MRAMREVLDAGRSCIFLVPEIALTPQTVGRLRSRLGEYQLVVWHSNLTDGQRLDAWRMLASGKARVVVGARSCIFAPLENIGLIIVDEEHDGAYKQDKNPRYNGRDVAVLRAKTCGAVCVFPLHSQLPYILLSERHGTLCALVISPSAAVYIHRSLL